MKLNMEFEMQIVCTPFACIVHGCLQECRCGTQKTVNIWGLKLGTWHKHGSLFVTCQWTNW